MITTTTTTSTPRTLVSHPETQSHHSLPVFKVIGEPPRSALERLLSLFADVRAGEGISTLLLALNVFLLLAGYSLMKPARDGLILTEGGAEVASYSAAAQAVLLMGVVPLYGWLGHPSSSRIRLISIMMTFFARHAIGFYVGGVAGLREGVAFYIWIGLINVFIVSQFWAVCERPLHGRPGAPAVSDDRGRTVARCMGRRRDGRTAGRGTELHAVHADVPRRVRAAGRARSHAGRQSHAKCQARAADAQTAAKTPLGPQGGFELIWQDRYLFWIAILIVLLNVVNTTGGYILNRLIVRRSGGSVRHGRGHRCREPSVRHRVFRVDHRDGESGRTCCCSCSSTSRSHPPPGRARRAVHPAGASRWSTTRSSRLRRCWRSSALARSSRTAPTTRSRTRCGRRCSCRRPAKPNTRPRRRSIRSSRVPATSSPPASSDLAQLVGLATSAFAAINVALTIVWLWVARQIAKEHRRRTV